MTQNTRSTDQRSVTEDSSSSSDAMSGPLAGTIHLSQVTKTYPQALRQVHALQGVDLTIEMSGFYAVMGPSGSGKSTLLHLMAALDQPDSGTIEVADCHLENLSEGDLTRFRRHHVGVVFQQYNLIPTMTALDNVALPGLLDGWSRSRRLSRSQELIDMLDLEGREHHRPDALSGGEQQRVSIARALFFSPAVLFADEPTGNLDTVASQHVWEILEKLATEQETTVVMVTHDPAAATYCREVFVLRDGRISGSFETEGLDEAELATRAQQLGR